MSTFNPWIDLPTALLSYAILVWILLRWARRDAADVLEKTQTTRIRLAMRLAIVFGTILLFAYLCNLAVWILLVAVGLLWFGVVGDSLREYLLGFPDLVLRPPTVDPKVKPETIDVTEYIGWKGIVSAPIYRSGEGKVDVDERSLPATSDCDSSINVGQAVTVRRVINGVLVVSPSE